MVIAVNFLDSDFIFECFSKLAQQYPQHQFIYIFDATFDEKYIRSKNIIPIVAGPQTKSTLLLKYWLNYKIPAILKKYKVDVFVCTGYCSSRTKVPQCIIINDLSFLHHPQFFTSSWLRFYKSNTAKFLSKAKAVITTSQFLKQEIAGIYKIETNKINVAYQCAGQYFKPINWQQKENTKEKYTQGKEYFLYSGANHPSSNLIVLLKAFSFFKKCQKSNIQLVIASKTTATDKEFIKRLSSFKYRNEVKLFENIPPESLAQITASAYAVICPSIYQSTGESILQAMQSEVAVIASNSSAMSEICGNAALYINPNDFNDIADKMMMLFKDEDKRNQLIIKGKQQAAFYNWDKSIEAVWVTIKKCVN